VGPSGENIPLRGLLDTASDVTVMPAALTEVFGYADADLANLEVRRASGTANLKMAKTPLNVAVAGEPTSSSQLRPLFAPDVPEILLGRDFMSTFNVSIVERDAEFALFWR
jgi:hypothetical protein